MNAFNPDVFMRTIHSHTVYIFHDMQSLALILASDFYYFAILNTLV